MTNYLVSEPRPATDNPADYVNLADYEARKQPLYVSGDITRATVEAALRGVRAALQVKPDLLLSDAIELGVPNVDHGATYVSNYELRQVIGRRLAVTASVLNKANKPNKPADVVKAALEGYEAKAA